MEVTSNGCYSWICRSKTTEKRCQKAAEWNVVHTMSRTGKFHLSHVACRHGCGAIGARWCGWHSHKSPCSEVSHADKVKTVSWVVQLSVVSLFQRLSYYLLRRFLL